jgi:DNA invertase Pin-like site-specific DNA recombinase
MKERTQSSMEERERRGDWKRKKTTTTKKKEIIRLLIDNKSFNGRFQQVKRTETEQTSFVYA